MISTAANAKSEPGKLEDNVGGDDASQADVEAKSEMKVDTDDNLYVESVNNKPTEADQESKKEPTEEIEVEVEEFYVKYKNL